MSYSIEKVTTLIGARRYGDCDAQIGFVLTDSRSLCFPEETLFFALKTGRNDGFNYIPDLYRRGVRNFVVENVPEDWEEQFPKSNFLNRRHNRLQRKDRREGVDLSVAVAADGRNQIAALLQLADWRAAVGVADGREYAGGSVRGRYQ